MHIQVMTGFGTHEAPDPVGSVLAGLKRTDNGYPVVHADAYATQGLLEILEVRAARGEREMMVLQCSRDQIRAVLEWQSETEDCVDLEDLVIHLVRKDPTERNAG